MLANPAAVAEFHSLLMSIDAKSYEFSSQLP